MKVLLQNEQKKCLDLHRRYQAELARRKKLHNTIQEMKGNIRVMCRVRPLLKPEIRRLGSKSSADWIKFSEEYKIAAINTEIGKTSNFEFDRVFSPEETQETVYEEISPLAISALDGYNVAILAYGQTGSGKTYTMEGLGSHPGVAFRAIREIFSHISERKGTAEYEVSLTYLEVYNEKIRNLLDKRSDRLELMETSKNKLKIIGLSPVVLRTPEEAIKLYDHGRSNRVVGVTHANEYSSRSHMDLAGSERLTKSEVEGDRLKEGTSINLSLTTLGKVLNSLASKSSHVPYRDSKLTHLLKNSIGGDAKTLVIVQVSPNPEDLSEGFSTLQFGSRVCNVEKGKLKKHISKIT